MRLILKQNESTVNEFQFGRGPIYIGRHTNSQIFLNHRAVSRQHAVIFQTQDGKWVVEDLDSANKTYLNDEAIHKAEINTGDILRIIDFTIEVDLGKDIEAEKTIDLEDTLSKTAYNLETSLAAPPHDVIVRKLNTGHAPALRLPAKRLADFSEATEAIAKVDDTDELLLALLNITLKQFIANRAWCALRKRPEGPMTTHAGKQQDGRSVDLEEIKLSKKITQAIENGEYLVMPRVPAQTGQEDMLRSAMIAPIMRAGGCFGVIYVDKAVERGHYSLSDLDYLMLITIHTATVLEKG